LVIGTIEVAAAPASISFVLKAWEIKYLMTSLSLGMLWFASVTTEEHNADQN
jgi:hypothetical protein